jgi:hypothetical protein
MNPCLSIQDQLTNVTRQINAISDQLRADASTLSPVETQKLQTELYVLEREAAKLTAQLQQCKYYQVQVAVNNDQVQISALMSQIPTRCATCTTFCMDYRHHDLVVHPTSSHSKRADRKSSNRKMRGVITLSTL